MALNKETVIQILELKHKDENLRLSRVGRKAKKGEVLLSNRDIAEQILGSRSAESTVRRMWAEYKKKGNYRGIVVEGGLAGGRIHAKQEVRQRLNGSRFVITSAQNNTLIHEDFFQSLLKYCEEEDAQLLVSGFHYNKNGFSNGKQEGSWFDKRLLPYMVNESVEIADGLVFCAELDINPTAVNPISGLHNYTEASSAIIPHAKLQMESMPTPKHDEPRLMYTSGTITLRNYVQKKMGQKAEHHHTFSALIVEVDQDGDWFVRQMNCESSTGNFYDLDKYYTKAGVTAGHTIEAVNYGDIHGVSISPHVEYACWEGEGNILDTLKPKYQFLHDSLSQARRSHHNMKCALYLFSQYSKKEECVKEEVKLTTDLISKLDRDFSQRVVVDSNHDRALQRWVLEQDFKKDPVNAIFMLEMTLDLFKAVESGEDFHMFENACRSVDSRMDSVRFLRTDEQFKVCGSIECGSHSDLGNNGGRGSVMAYQKVGHRFNIGHSHQATIKDGVYQSGMSGDLEQGYNKGNSSWNNSHILTYSNGKRTIITQKGNKWRGILGN